MSLSLNLDRSIFLTTADQIGCDLCRDAIWDGRRCTWMGWSKEKVAGQWGDVYRSMSPDLYGGSSGIALFLAELYRFTQDKQQLRAVEGAVEHALSNLQMIQDGLVFGFYTGYLGVAYAIIRVAEILGREDWIAAGLALVERMCQRPRSEQTMLDLLSGSAGVIPVLLQLAQRYDRPNWLGVAEEQGRYLIRTAEVVDGRCSWRTLEMPVFANLTGYSHGVAGISIALLELDAVLDDPIYRDTALKAWRFEADMFDQTQQNWPDNRNIHPANPASKPGFCMAWCHGAPGIGMARLRACELLPDHQGLRQDLERAISVTAHSTAQALTHSIQHFSLCHGVAGNAELLCLAAMAESRPDLFAIADQLGLRGVELYGSGGAVWPCGIGNGAENPNLMLGTAGIGHFYLRLYAQQALPSILLVRGSSFLGDAATKKIK